MRRRTITTTVARGFCSIRMSVLGEGAVEELMGSLDAPVAPYDEQPLGIGESRAWQAGDEVAVVVRDPDALGVEGLDLDAEHGPEMLPTFRCGKGFSWLGSGRHR
ncbi:MAG: hypothetical protein IPM35_13425 [Myxococcales bacterium]|nr:hypothetical protein [Myxococcales bacterium]